MLTEKLINGSLQNKSYMLTEKLIMVAYIASIVNVCCSPIFNAKIMLTRHKR